MEKNDLKKMWKSFYSSSKREFEIVDVPEFSFLMVDGRGDPNTAENYREAIEGLYPVAYSLKFISKKRLAKDFVVAPLEGLWWADSPDKFHKERDKDSWEWTAMIHMPAWINGEMFSEARQVAGEKKDLPALDKMRLEAYHEGLSVQILHIGTYADEGPTLLRLHDEYLPTHDLREAGKHHEIYLSDPRRTEPARLKTILRQPVRQAG